VTPFGHQVDSVVDWRELIDLTEEMIQLASSDRWDALSPLHRARESLLAKAYLTEAQLESSEGLVRKLAGLNQLLANLAEQKKRGIANRLERLRRESSACTAYRGHSFDNLP